MYVFLQIIILVEEINKRIEHVLACRPVAHCAELFSSTHVQKRGVRQGQCTQRFVIGFVTRRKFVDDTAEYVVRKFQKRRDCVIRRLCGKGQRHRTMSRANSGFEKPSKKLVVRHTEEGKMGISFNEETWPFYLWRDCRVS